MAKEKVIDEKPKAKRGRKPKTTETKIFACKPTVQTVSDVVLELNDKINSDREMFFDVITQIRKRISDFEHIHFVLDCVILIALFIITLALIYK